MGLRRAVAWLASGACAGGGRGNRAAGERNSEEVVAQTVSLRNDDERAKCEVAHNGV